MSQREPRRRPDRRHRAWVGDYTIQPENGGMISVFTHEYGHDLGLPDLYDTAGGGRERRQLVVDDGAEPSAGPTDDGHRRAGSDFGAWDKLQLGWLDYEIVAAGAGPHAIARPARVQHRRRPRPGRRLPEEARSHDRCHRRPAPRPGGAAKATTYPHDDASRDAAGGRLDADASGATGTSRTAAGPLRLRLRRGQRRHRLESDPRQHHQGGRGQRHRRHQRRLDPRRPSTCRRTPARRSACGSATPPTAPPAARASSPTTIKRHVGRRHAVHVRCRGLHRGLDAGRLLRGRCLGRPRRTTTTTSRRTATTSRSTSTCRPARTTSGRSTRTGHRRALPVPGRPAAQLLGHLGAGQTTYRVGLILADVKPCPTANDGTLCKR